jgi:flavin-dependent dehydrogenase
MISPQTSEFFVIGGGPAGTSAAIALASAGRQVFLAESTCYTGYRIGETLPPAANPVLDRLGIDRGAVDLCGLRCPGSVSVWGSELPYRNDSLFDPDGNGIHLDRVAFDRLLAARAAAIGVRVMTSCQVRSCCRAGHEWLVTFYGPDGIQEVVASTIIDASGRAPWPGRPSHRQTIDRQVAIVGQYKMEKNAGLDHWTWVESTRDGWWYSAVLPVGRLVAAYFTDTDLLDLPKANRDRRFTELITRTRWIHQRVQGARLIYQPRVVAATSTISRPIAGDGWAAVGDAASTIDPLSSRGILNAITSGLNAAAALLVPDQHTALAQYAQAITSQFRNDLTTRAHMCRRERRWVDSPFWRRRVDAAVEDKSGRKRGHSWIAKETPTMTPFSST